MIDLSSNEAASLVKLATRGAGYPWGVGEEAAYASRWFAEHQVPSLSVFSQLLEWSDHYSLEALTIDLGAKSWVGRSGDMCPLLAGCSISDLASRLDQGQSIVLEKVVFAIVLLPFFHLVSLELQSPITARWADGELKCDAATQGSISTSDSVRDQLHTRHTPRTITITRGDLISASLQSWPIAETLRVSVDVQSLNGLKQLAHRTYAPATEQSRLSGAGAGTSDND